MKCFRHTSVDAVGLCMVCGKGLCPACGVHLSRSLTCAGQCSEIAQRQQAEYEASREKLAAQDRQLRELKERFRQLPSAQGGLFVSVFLLLAGLPFLLLGFGANDKAGLGRWLGGVFVVMGLARLLLHRKATKTVRGGSV
jgi:hypothetical protein